MEQEVNFVLQFLLQVPDTPVCLIGIQPDQDALPHFFPVIYPFLQEPKDVEEYAEIADKLKVWRVKFKMIYDLMVEMFTSMDKELEEKQLTPMQLKDLMINVHSTFGRWTDLLKQLFKHSNDLLQLNIMASNTVQHKHKASTMEKEIVEILMESRIHHNKPLHNGWISTADYCVELAKVRLTAMSNGKYRHEDILWQTWTTKEQRIILDERQETLREVQRRLLAPLIGATGTSKKGRPPLGPKR